MPIAPASLSELLNVDHDEVIDVRSPSEFAEDHIPGAVNLPVLYDEERALVGTVYTRENRFRGRRIGAALVARNAAKHLEEYLADKGPSYRPLVYCWRGGQRSGSFATILSQIGWRVDTLAGGYRTYRALVGAILYENVLPHRVVLIDGNTGTAKTEILTRLGHRGVQVIDLEGLANHRGSLFGAREGGQPSQKAFESELARRLVAFDPARPVVIEAESSKVGDRVVPPSLWTAMSGAVRIEVQASLDARAAYLARAYSDLTSAPDAFEAVLNALRPYHASDTIAEWRDLLRRHAHEALARRLMSEHYDPRYAKSRARHSPKVVDTVALDDMSSAALDTAAARIASAVERLQAA